MILLSHIFVFAPGLCWLMNSAVLQLSVSEKASMGGWFDAISTQQTENQQPTWFTIHPYAGVLRLLIVPWKQRLIFVLLTQLLETSRMVQLKLYLNGRRKGRSHSHITSTPDRNLVWNFLFYSLHAEHPLTVWRSFIEWLRVCTLSVLLKTVACASTISWDVKEVFKRVWRDLTKML